MFKPRHSKLDFNRACPENFRRGLTLVEILVGITMSTLLIGALYGVYLVSYKSYTRSANQAELNQNARIAMERMSRDLRQTNRILTTLPSTNTDDLNPAPKQIEFQDGHNTSTVSYIKYYLDGKNLKRQLYHYALSNNPDVWVTYDTPDSNGGILNPIPDGEAAIKAEFVTTLQFYGENKIININIKVSNTTSTYNQQTEVYARNL